MLIHTEKLRWLFWLRWKMVIRGFTRSSGRVSRIIGTVFLVLFGLPFLGSIAVGTYFAYRYLPAPANSEVLFLVLTALFLLWAILPLFEFSVNEGLDISKLALFPLTRAELMLSLIFSTLLDIPTLGLFLVLGAVVAGWFFSLPLGLMALLTMLVFYVQLVSVSQLVLALLMRVLLSRRFRDLSVIVIALFSSSCYLIQQVVFRTLSFGSGNIVEGLMHARVSPYLQWLPPGMAARAIQDAYHGNWGGSFLWLGVLLVISIVFLYLWQSVVERGLTSASSEGSVRVRRSRVETVSTGVSSPVARGLIGRIRASQTITIVGKDLKYFRRDPQLQAALVSSVMSIMVLVVITFVNSGNSSHNFLGSWVVLASPAFVFLSLYTFSSNVLGLERQSLTTLLLFPVDPRQILWGKNIVVFLLGTFEIIALIFLSAFTSHAWNYVLPAFAVGFAGIGVVLGCGNFTSVFFPQRMRQMRRGMQTAANLSSEGGCLRSVMSLVALGVTMIVLLPVMMALVLPLIFRAEWIWSLSIPASFIYGAALYYVVTALVAPRILDRVPEILEIVARE